MGYGFNFFAAGDYAILDYSEFTPSPDFADYADYLATNYDISTPDTQLIQNFSYTVDTNTGITTETGLGQFFIHPDAVPGTDFRGVLTVVFDLYSVDPNSPNFDPTLDALNYGVQFNVPVGRDVVAPASPTPEPVTCMLVGFALLIVGSASIWRHREKGMLTH